MFFFISEQPVCNQYSTIKVMLLVFVHCKRKFTVQVVCHKHVNINSLHNHSLVKIIQTHIMNR